MLNEYESMMIIIIIIIIITFEMRRGRKVGFEPLTSKNLNRSP